MNAKKARAQRQARRAPSARPQTGRSFWTDRRTWMIGAIVAVVLAASFVLPGVLRSKSVSAGAEHAMAMGADQGEGLPVGSAVPQFAARDVETGAPITSNGLYAQKTLLFFSEGIMCQACFQQIKDIESFASELTKRHIRLVSITPDSPSELDQVIRQVGITTPMISDSSRTMSEAFNTLGKGMHGDTPGHAFALIHRGKMLWYRDYWLPPYRTMYVRPAQLLKDIPA